MEHSFTHHPRESAGGPGAAWPAARQLSWHIDEDGCWVMEGRFTAEQGAVIRKALEKAMDEQFEERQNEHPDVAAATWS